MPILDNLRHGAFAQVRAKAKGARLALLDAARVEDVLAGVRRLSRFDIVDEFGRLARAAGAVHA